MNKTKAYNEPEEDYDAMKVIRENMIASSIGESPINLNLTKTIPVMLSPLSWHHHGLPPKKMKCTNTGHTLILSAKWHQERPFLSDGPLFGNYVFSQLHFHWGKNDMEGSEHHVDGSALPLEMHVIFFKSTYLTQEAALKKRDGIVVLVYFFKLQAGNNIPLEFIADVIPSVRMPHSSVRMDNIPLAFFVPIFENDYFTYWGSINTSECKHVVLWMISRVPLGIAIDQMENFRTLLNVDEQPLLDNFRPLQTDTGVKRTVFHVNPSLSLYSTLLPIMSEDPKASVVKRTRDRTSRRDSLATGAGEVEDTAVFSTTTEFHRSPFRSDAVGEGWKKGKGATLSTLINVNQELLDKLKGAKILDEKSGGKDIDVQERARIGCNVSCPVEKVEDEAAKTTSAAPKPRKPSKIPKYTRKRA